MKIRCILDAIEEFAPRALQGDYDNAGLQAGDSAKDCTGVLLTLDVTEGSVEEAIERDCNLIISHHPLLFKGVKCISPATETGRILMKAIQNGVAIYAAHTNLDNAWGGVSFRMAEKLGMTSVRVLQPQEGRLSKIVTFVPDSHRQAVEEALFAAGAGCIGNYDSCSYTLQGTGSFRPLDGANPYVGERGTVHREAETRVEVIIPSWLTAKAVSALLKAHPYEEPAYDVIPLANADRYSGSGAVGEIEPTTVGKLLERLQAAFGTKAIRYSGDKEKTVSRVALCGGSGAFLTGDAIAAGADIYITGDLKYHDFTTFAGQIALADIGHYESEQCAKEIFGDILRERFPQLPVVMAETDINPINYHI